MPPGWVWSRKRLDARFCTAGRAKSDFNENLGLEKGDGKTQPCTWLFISQRIRKGAVLPREKLKGGVVEDNLNKWILPEDKAEWAARDAGIYLHWGKTIQVADTRDPVAVCRGTDETARTVGTRNRSSSGGWFYMQSCPQKWESGSVAASWANMCSPSRIFREGRFPDDKVAEAWYDLDPWGNAFDPCTKGGAALRHSVSFAGPQKHGRTVDGRTHHQRNPYRRKFSYRVQPLCSNTGEAAGTAAAMAARHKTGIRDIEIRELQASLDAHGLFDFTKSRQK